MTAINELKSLSNKVLINVEFRDSGAGDGLDVVVPTAEETIGQIPFAGIAAVDEAIDAGKFEIDVAGERIPVKASLSTMYDPKAERMRG